MEYLIKELTTATGPDYRLDYRIHLAVDGNTVVPRYTSSLDAALTLIPEGYGWRIDWKSQITGKAWASAGRPGEQETAEGATAPIALCIAALNARLTSIDEPRFRCIHGVPSNQVCGECCGYK